MAETIYLATTGNDTTAIHGNIDFPYATLTTALTSISSHDTTLLIKDGTYTLTSSNGTKDVSNSSNEPSDDPYPNLVHVFKSNITLSAENVHKSIIDCQNTQGGIWFLTNFADGINSSNRLGDNDNSGVGDTRQTSITLDGLVIANFKKTATLNNNRGSAVKNGSSAGFINVSQGFVPAVGQPGSDITVNRCVLSACIVQNSSNTDVGIVSTRRQDTETATNNPLSAELNLTDDDTIRPLNETADGGVRITYKNCLFNKFSTDETDEAAGSFGLFTFRNIAEVEDPPSTGDTIVRPVTANLINNIFYFKETGGKQYKYLFHQRANELGDTKAYNNSFSITNNIFYNTGDNIDTVFQISESNYTGGVPSLDYSYGQGSTTTNTVTSLNVYSNNCFFGFTSAAGFPFSMEFNSVSGNLFDTDPQLLAPTQNRFGLRQSSPCKGVGVTTPTIL